MRFNRVRSTTFSRVVAPTVSRELKDIRRVRNQDTYTSTTTRNLGPKEQLDYVAQQIWGEGNEFLWYVLADRNMREIIGWNLDFSKIRTLEVPALTEYGA